MTDRERILTEIVRQLATTQLLAKGVPRFSEEAFRDRLPSGSESLYVHFAYWEKPKAGDLVLAMTGGIGEWTVAWYVEQLPPNVGGAVVREIGTGRLCNYRNEDFVPIVGLHKSQLLEGEQNEFVNKVHAAFARGDEYTYRYGGVDFEGGGARIWIREVFGGGLSGGGSKPFSFVMPFTKKTSVKAILKAMRDNGYGTRKFERVDHLEKPQV